MNKYFRWGLLAVSSWAAAVHVAAWGIMIYQAFANLVSIPFVSFAFILSLIGLLGVYLTFMVDTYKVTVKK